MARIRRAGAFPIAIFLLMMTTGNAFQHGQALPGAMSVGAHTSQPIGHYRFCRTHRGECAIRARSLEPERMTIALRQRLAEINAQVNRSIRPLSDTAQFGSREVWSYPVAAGDCEDYALLKRRMLHKAGIPLSNLLMTLVRKPDGEGHAVLTVRTDQGDFVLDNRRERILRWDRTGYRFVKRQAVANTGDWVSIQRGRVSRVAATD